MEADMWLFLAVSAYHTSALIGHLDVSGQLQLDVRVQ